MLVSHSLIEDKKMAKMFWKEVNFETTPKQRHYYHEEVAKKLHGRQYAAYCELPSPVKQYFEMELSCLRGVV